MNSGELKSIGGFGLLIWCRQRLADVATCPVLRNVTSCYGDRVMTPEPPAVTAMMHTHGPAHLATADSHRFRFQP